MKILWRLGFASLAACLVAGEYSKYFAAVVTWRVPCHWPDGSKAFMWWTWGAKLEDDRPGRLRQYRLEIDQIDLRFYDSITFEFCENAVTVHEMIEDALRDKGDCTLSVLHDDPSSKNGIIEYELYKVGHFEGQGSCDIQFVFEAPPLEPADTDDLTVIKKWLAKETSALALRNGVVARLFDLTHNLARHMQWKAAAFTRAEKDDRSVNRKFIPKPFHPMGEESGEGGESEPLLNRRNAVRRPNVDQKRSYKKLQRKNKRKKKSEKRRARGRID